MESLRFIVKQTIQYDEKNAGFEQNSVKNYTVEKFGIVPEVESIKTSVENFAQVMYVK